MNPLLFVALIALPSVTLAFPGRNVAQLSAQPAAPKAAEDLGDVVAVLSADSRFSTLVTAVAKAGLVEALQGAGPFTILAPVNSGFDGVDVDALLNDVPALTAVLLRHVVDAEVYSKDVSNGPVQTKGGDTITANTDNGVTFTYNTAVATVVEADIKASNGVIHAIDKVIA